MPSSSSSPADARSVTLRKGITGTYVEGRTQGYLLKLEVTETVDVDPYLFVFQRKPGTLPGAPATDEFSNVASPADLQEYPVGEPTSTSPFFRLAVVELVFRNIDLIYTSVNDIESDIASLVESLNQLEELDEQTVVIQRARYVPEPSPCEAAITPESSSSCDSSSSSSTPLRRAVTLKIGKAQEFDDGRVQGYRITVEVIEAVGLPEEIFVYQRMTLVQGNAPQDDFSNVASPADLEEYPLSEPTESSPFFRLKTIELVYRDLELLNENLNDLKRDICMLLDSLAQMDRLVEEIIVIDERCAIGAVDPCPPLPPITARVVAFPRDPTVTDDALAGYGTGSLWTNTVTGDVFTLLNNLNGSAVWELIAIGLTVGSLTRLNKSMAANVTTADGQLATNTPVAAQPYKSSYIIVTVNDHGVAVGDGVKTKECYFSRDLGTSALQFSAVQAGDRLYWNGSVAKYQLEIDDVVSFNYIS